MDMLDQALESSQDKVDSGSEDHIELTTDDGEASGVSLAGVAGQSLTIDSSGQYRLSTDTGQGVTYRVVQVAQDEGGVQTQMLTANALQTQQQVLSTAFGSADGMEGMNETKIAYLPSVTGGGDSIISQQPTEIAGTQLGQVSTAGGQFYVMMSPQDVLQAAGQRVIVPRTGLMAGQRNESPRSSRDDRRRASHNEVERRRRDKINNWIVQLSKQLPDCSVDHSKTGQSKGGILSKACEYIQELRTANQTMGETLKDTERLAVDNELLKQQVEELKQENMMLSQQLQQHGIVLPDITGLPGSTA